MLFVAVIGCVLYVSGAVAVLRRIFPKYNGRILTVIGGDEAAEKPPERATLRSSWFWIGLLVVCCSLVMLESLQPYYFAQDDVHRGELPGMLFACRTLWQGHLPQYNPYQLMGAPVANLGYASLTYPPTYLAYAIARHLLHNEYAMADIFAIMHILIGYPVAYLLSRRLNIGPMSATLAALSFELSGSILMIGRSWHTFVPLAVYLPLIVLGALTLAQRPLSWRATLGTGLAIGLFYQVGFSQIWIYAIAVFSLLVPLFCLQANIPVRKALNALPALLIGIGLSAPLALQQYLMTRDVVRSSGNGNGIIDGVFAMLLPYPLVKADHPNNWGMEGRAKMGCLYFFGGLFAFLLILHAVLLISSRPTRRLWRAQPLFILSVMMFVFAATNSGPWALLVRIPMIGKINHYPFRLLPFFVFFAVLCGGVLLERLLEQVQFRAARKKWEMGIGVAAIGVLLYYVHLAPPSFNSLNYPPYPALPAPIRETLIASNRANQERTNAWTLQITPKLSAGVALNCNMSSVYEIPAYNGYDPIIQGDPQYRKSAALMLENPLEAARAYGIEWNLDENPTDLLPGDRGYSDVIMEPYADHLTKSATTSLVAVRKLDGVDPLAFSLSDRTRGLPINMHGEGLDVDVRGLRGGGPVVVNFLWYPDMKARIDGAPINCSSDSWGRMLVSVPAGTKSLEIRYQPPWGMGALLGAVVMLAGCGLFLRRGQGQDDVSAKTLR